MLACAVAVQLGAEQHFHPLGQDQKPCVWQLCWALRQASLGVLPAPVPLPPPPGPRVPSFLNQQTSSQALALLHTLTPACPSRPRCTECHVELASRRGGDGAASPVTDLLLPAFPG